ncbi:hypothetical protein PR202_ga00156 [Eleusine coracana subsp. coracana]|uniref:Uncharacterized protein n=1 Tax=Eleusine coracana subsp. coracana TaxID=191504 RepID=A0AAV5BEI4_ELECO|nr:hypothetical protein PR202_ga00156 [Eleusine coracana subsp. coracana]
MGCTLGPFSLFAGRLAEKLCSDGKVTVSLVCTGEGTELVHTTAPARDGCRGHRHVAVHSARGLVTELADGVFIGRTISPSALAPKKKATKVENQLISFMEKTETQNRGIEEILKQLADDSMAHRQSLAAVATSLQLLQAAMEENRSRITAFETEMVKRADENAQRLRALEQQAAADLEAELERAVAMKTTPPPSPPPSHPASSSLPPSGRINDGKMSGSPSTLERKIDPACEANGRHVDFRNRASVEGM